MPLDLTPAPLAPAQHPAEHPDYVLVAFGSAGDILPVAAIALALQARGHSVWFLAPAPFEAPARLLGLNFFSILDEADSLALMNNPRLWHPCYGFQIMWPFILTANQAADNVESRSEDLDAADSARDEDSSRADPKLRRGALNRFLIVALPHKGH